MTNTETKKETIVQGFFFFFFLIFILFVFFFFFFFNFFLFFFSSKNNKRVQNKFLFNFFFFILQNRYTHSFIDMSKIMIFIILRTYNSLMMHVCVILRGNYSSKRPSNRISEQKRVQNTRNFWLFEENKMKDHPKKRKKLRKKERKERKERKQIVERGERGGERMEEDRV